MGTGMVRGIYNLGYDSVWLKWYVFHDPYARLGLLELFRISLVKIALFYSLLVTLAALLWRSPAGRRLLLLLAILTLPHLGLALRFESGSPERYLGPLGLVAVAIGYVLAQERGWRRSLVLMLCCAPVGLNVLASSAGAINAGIQHDVQRIQPLLGIPASSPVFVVDLKDGLVSLRYAAPFHPIQKEVLPDINTIQPPGPTPWRSAFACAAQLAWAGNAQVWITIRTLRKEPIREWLWVEGDDPSIRWADVHTLASSLERGEIRGGDDGFFALQDTVLNRRILKEALDLDPAHSTCRASN
jgi:hypothetical protein